MDRLELEKTFFVRCLTELHETFGVEKQHIAKVLGVTPRTISNWFSGKVTQRTLKTYGRIVQDYTKKHEKLAGYFIKEL